MFKASNGKNFVSSMALRKLYYDGIKTWFQVGISAPTAIEVRSCSTWEDVKVSDAGQLKSDAIDVQNSQPGFVVSLREYPALFFPMITCIQFSIDVNHEHKVAHKYFIRDS